jgi:hypothetical protein
MWDFTHIVTVYYRKHFGQGVGTYFYLLIKHMCKVMYVVSTVLKHITNLTPYDLMMFMLL